MWLRYGIHILLACNAYALPTSDDETTAWIASETLSAEATKLDTTEKPPNTKPKKLDLTPTFIATKLHTTEKPTNTKPKKLDLTPTFIETTIDCITDDKSRGKCVLAHKCYNEPIRYNTNSSIDVRKDKKQCPSSIEVCCPIEQNADSDDVVNLISPYSNTQNMINLEASDQCGWTNINTTTSPSSEYAIYQEFRWMVAIMRKRKGITTFVLNDFIGGGSLIHPSVVITVAHKVINIKKRQLKCRAGEFDTQNNETYKFLDRDVNNVTIHPSYDNISQYYDVALLFLKERINLDVNFHIGLACLSKELPKAGTECFTMGWGMLPKEGKYANTLKKIKVPLVDAGVCQANLRTTRLGRYFELHSSLTCAGGKEGADACHNDGGSSLVCPIQQEGVNVRYAMVGMVAYGVQCGHKNRPGVYVNIPAVYTWINEVMTNKSYGTATYTI